jgi:hypothetical protein
MMACAFRRTSPLNLDASFTAVPPTLNFAGQYGDGHDSRYDAGNKPDHKGEH